MTPESKEWTALAKRISEGYIEAPEVEGIALGGSVSRGHADANSDVDIFVFCRRFPDARLRESAVCRVHGERWKSHDARRPEGVMRDCFWSGDGRVDVELVLVESLESIMHDVLVCCDTNRTKQAFLGGLLDSVTLYDENLIAGWREQIVAYPDGLSQGVVESHIFMEPLWIPEVYATRRGDLLYLCEAMCRVSNDILGSLHGMNRVYQPSEYKRLDWVCSRLALAPDGLADRLKDVFEGSPLDGVEPLASIVSETFELVAEHMPMIDVETARTGFTTDSDTEPEGEGT